MQPDQNRPCILIHVFPHAGCEGKIREVQAGMEEEGIPYSVVHSNEKDAVALSYEGALKSKLGVGLGIGAESLCIHYVKLPAQKPLFVLNEAGNSVQWRHFGYNAARLVKGIPFKGQPSEDEDLPIHHQDALYDIVYRIVQKVLQESAQGHGEVKAWSTTR